MAHNEERGEQYRSPRYFRQVKFPRPFKISERDGEFTIHALQHVLKELTDRRIPLRLEDLFDVTYDRKGVDNKTVHVDKNHIRKCLKGERRIYISRVKSPKKR